MIIDGKYLSEKLNKEIKIRIEDLKIKTGLSPVLAIIKIGENESSEIYVRNKILKCKELGIITKLYEYNENIDSIEIINLILELNDDPFINAIIVQLPIPKNMDKVKIIQSINPDKDVDAFTFYNSGKSLMSNSFILPCTASGIIYILKLLKIKIEGSHAVIIGRSEIVGKPTAFALLNENATITICHSKTNNLKYECLRADILICAIGKPKFIKEDMIKPNSVVIDVGINKTDLGICGDVDFKNVLKKVSYITPVPGGIGPMTVSYLMKNTLSLFENHLIKI